MLGHEWRYFPCLLKPASGEKTHTATLRHRGILSQLFTFQSCFIPGVVIKGDVYENASAKHENTEFTDFEAWARLLVRRKVPDRFQDLINSEVVSDGAAILKHGEAFEVRICDQTIGRVSGGVEGTRPAGKHILVSPFPVLSMHSRLHGTSP